MEIVVLGCGTSTGVPIVSCKCRVCSSGSPLNTRLRASAAVLLPNGHNILIDTSPDLRQQALANKLFKVDCIFYTHCHADHTHGIDEIRTYNYIQRRAVDIYGVSEHIDHIRDKFSYIFEDSIQEGGGKPLVNMHEVEPGEAFELFGETVAPIELLHGRLRVLGWRIGDFAYITDVNHIPEQSYKYLEKLKLLIIGALRWEPHPTHYSIGEAQAEAEKIKPERCLITHMGHEIDYDELNGKLPDWISPANDGIRIKLE